MIAATMPANAAEMKGHAPRTISSAAIAIYHTGVERKLWEGPTSCTSGGTSGVSADELFDQIMAAPLVRCDEVPWELAGLSMASWNGIVALVLALIWVMAARARV